MANSDLQAIIATLAYYDVFDYPLTREEVEKYLVKKIATEKLVNVLQSNKIEKVGDFFALKGRKDIGEIRVKREKISKKKLKKIDSLEKLFYFLPTILYVGVSGSLALKNAKDSDDIDLFIITTPHALWLSRLFVNGLLVITGKLRLYGKSHTKNSMCTNMWIDSDHLIFPPLRQNAYTAHEIVQLLPVVNKNNMYEQFVQENNWIHQFLPNIRIPKIQQYHYSTNTIITLLDTLAQKIQLWYMKKHRTTETITDGFVAFHPHDYTQNILHAWEKRQNI